MDKEQQQEWHAMERQAFEALRRSHVSPHGSESVLFHLVVLPSFEDAFAWEVCQQIKPHHQKETFALYSVWRRNTDYSRMETPVVRLKYPRPLYPTIHSRRVPLPNDWVEATINALQNVSIDAFAKVEMYGTDGTSYELMCGDWFAQARYSWWEEPPQGWRSLHDWTQRTLQELHTVGSASDVD